MKILLTGGMGYIGSHTAVELIKTGHEVVILDNLFNSKRTVLDKIFEITGVRPEFYEVDLLDAEKVREVFRENEVEAVMHFAGLKAVGESVEKPLLYYRNNIGGTVNLLEAMKEYGVRRLIFSSSATVYGAQDEKKYVETMETGKKLSNPYGRTKYMIEEISKDCAAVDSEMEVVLLRYFNPVGVHESGLLGEDPNGIPNNLMPIIMKVVSGDIPELSIYGDDYETPDGTCLRDYLHVMDLARGHVAALTGMKPGVTVYNLGTGKTTSVLEMVTAFEKESGEKLPCKIVGRREGDLPEFYADPSKAEKELGWKAEKTIEDAMRDTLRFLRKNNG